ncbi:MAG: hypothetical protein ACOH1E_01205 [Brevundimonas sp.]
MRSYPKTLEQPFDDFIAARDEMGEALLLHRRAVEEMQYAGELGQALHSSRERELGAEVALERLKFTEALAEKAKREVSGGHQLLLYHAVVSTWAMLEVAVISFAAKYLELAPSIPDYIERKCRVPAGLALSTDRSEMFRHIINDVERQTDSNLKAGMGRFSTILEAIGIDVWIDENYRRDLLELSKVRNLIAHKRGLVDSKFVSECPWHPSKVGERVQISFEDFSRYEKAAAKLAVAIVKGCESRWSAWASAEATNEA